MYQALKPFVPPEKIQSFGPVQNRGLTSSTVIPRHHREVPSPQGKAKSRYMADLTRVNDALCSVLDAVKSTASACASRLRETENTLSAEHEALKKATKRIHRLVNDKKKAADAKRKYTKATTTSQSSLEADIQSYLATILSLSTDNARLQGSLSNLKENSAVELKRLRAERKAFKMQAHRAQESFLRTGRPS
ncbi:hypothetical protein R3P38DRAFT_2815554 [Favolaschia claudopus]|uniref:Uncharacterized protein n=1 Tax=Favolaschia claudopus TaxID=2862362 RepID=A0AAV9Z199_9AGAR